MSASSKIEALEKFNVHVTEQIKEGVEVMTSYTAGLIKKYEKEGMAKGMAKGMDTFSELIRILAANNRSEEILLAASDENYRKKLLKEFNLDN